MPVELVTIEGVEIGSVGMEWPSSAGPFTLTAQNLADVMTAANDDPHIVTPRLKLGHEGWPDMGGLDSSPFGTSAEPALGRVENFRLTNDGATLVGDYVGVPAWIPAAYPSRSGEWLGECDPTFATGVITPGGKRYSMVLTAVALLGVACPALEDLDDLELFLTTGATKAGSAVAIATSEASVPQPVATRADIDTVQRSFWADFAQGDYFWWWPRDIYTEPNEVLADDDEGHLYRVPFASDDNGDITWGDPVRVRLDVVDIPDVTPDAVATAYRAVASTSAAMHRTFATAATARPAERHTQRSAAQVAAATQAGSSGPDNQEDDAMSGIDIPALRTRLGLTDEQLPDDATPEQINAAFAVDPPEADAPVEVEAEEAEADDAEEPDPIVAAQETALAATSRRVEELEARETARLETETATRRDAFATSAMKDGRFTPSEHDHYRGLLDVDEVRATALIEALPKGRVPVTEHGINPAATSTDSSDLLAATLARHGVKTPQEA